MPFNDLSSLAYVNLARLDSFSPLGTSRVIVWDTAGGGQVKYSTIQDLPVDIAWGEITGTLSNQTDLQAALDAFSADIVVKSFDDLPNPVAGVITLVASKTYKWEALLDGTLESPVVDQIILPNGGSVYSKGTASTVGFKSNSSKPAILILNATTTVSFMGPFRVENAGGTGLRAEGSQAFVEGIFIINCVTGLESHNNVFMTFTDITPFQCVDGFVLTGTNSLTTIVGGGPFLCTGKGFILDNSNGDIIIRNSSANTTDDCISLTGTYTEVDIESTSLGTVAGDCLRVTGTMVALVIVQPRYQTTTGITLDITGSALDNLEIEGGFLLSFTGTAAFKGDASSANITNNAIITGTAIGGAGTTSLVGITKKDLKYKFQGCLGVADSKSIGAYNLTVPVSTVVGVTPGVFTKVLGTTVASAQIERWSQTANNEVTYDDTETVGKTAIVTIAAKRTAGGGGVVYRFALFCDEGSGFTEITESNMPVELDQNERSVTLVAPHEIKSGEKISVFVTNTTGTQDVTVTDMSVVVNT